MNSFSQSRYDAELAEIFRRYPSVQNVPFADAYKPGLERMEKFDEILGFPDREFRTVHVAGTNGKGSVSNMLASALAASGCRTGLYTSPHILDFRERMKVEAPGTSVGTVAGMIPKEYVYDFILRYKADFERLSLSFFEITTGMALRWFADSRVDVAVMEVGLGGRLDSTNIITPQLSIVTEIGLDHCQMLGNTLAEIAGEKAGIFKKGVPALVGEVLPETEPVFVAKAEELGCELTFAQRVEPYMWKDKDLVMRNMDLRGHYQEKNLRTVMVAMDILCPSAPEQILEPAIENTARRMDFHGRWERISTNPTVICDIGHNADALKGNFAQLEAMKAEGYSSLIIIYAIMADKDLDAIMPLMPHDATYIFATPSTARALPSEKILQRYKAFRQEAGLDTDRLFACDSISDAVDEALTLCSFCGDRPLVYIGGSTFAVADAIPLFR